MQDNGTGIEQKDQQFIFERFTQITDNQKGKPKGSGLGLSITDEIIKLHQGALSVKSTKNRGATFSIKLEVIP
ncbi:MAG: ATP-binding protein [Bacteroidota bacterium]